MLVTQNTTVAAFPVLKKTKKTKKLPSSSGLAAARLQSKLLQNVAGLVTTTQENSQENHSRFPENQLSDNHCKIPRTVNMYST